MAPPVEAGVATDILSSTAFLYTGANPIQTGVDPGTIQLTRAAVLRGKVLDRANDPLPGAAISVLGHPEFGQTLSRADGMFDMAVNGGGQLTLRYEKTGFLPAQRTVDAPWRDFAWAPDVVLVPLDTAVTTIDLTGGTMQAARGNPATDADGTRQATVLFPGGTTANLVMPNGSTQPISTLHIRATEFTVGEDGPEAMPAALPASSGYTYAVELSADEAIAAEARGIAFSQPLPVYVENFAGFPVGGAVPAGYYDREKGQWIASGNGRVIKVVSITGGAADLDITGDDIADDASPLGVTSAERSQLATLYSAGQSLWRIPVQHFTAWDFNWPYGPPSDSITPPSDPLRENDPPVKDPHTECGSIIGCETQTLGESLPVSGTSFELSYDSERTPGRRDASTLVIPVSGPGPMPASLKRIRVEVTVAGNRYQQVFAPAPNINYSFVWDGKDAYGRQQLGKLPAKIDVHYDYTPQYYPVQDDQIASFSRPGFSFAAAFAARASAYITTTQTRTGEVGFWDARAAGLGGWDFDIHHAYDPTSRRILLGDGRERSSDSAATIVTTIAGGALPGSSGEGDGGPAIDAKLVSPGDIAAGPDGSVYFLDNDRVRRIAPNGIITTVAGGNPVCCFGGDGGPATAASINSNGIALGPDGSLYIVDHAINGGSKIRRVTPDGIINTFAGNGTYSFCGDGGPATSACLADPADVAVGQDGSVYIADNRNHRIRRVGTDGIITTFAGTGIPWTGYGSNGDGGPATDALVRPGRMAVGPDGSVYFTDSHYNGSVSDRVRRVRPDGVITTVAGGGPYSPVFTDGIDATTAWLYGLSGLDVGDDGSVYVLDGGGRSLRYVSPDGIVTTIGSNGAIAYDVDNFKPYRDGAPALAISLYMLGVALAPDGNLVVANDNGDFAQDARIVRIGPALPGISLSDVLIPSDDGRELYVFDSAGRHLRTLDALTGAIHFQFGYDVDGNLTSITDAAGNVTTVERNNNGAATAISAPGGQRTDLNVNADGWLQGVSDPLVQAHSMTYSADGLLQTFVQPGGNLHSFTYDSLGRLTRDDAPDGRSTALSRTDLADGYTVSTTSALGRVSTYTIQRMATGSIRSISTTPGGAATTTIRGADGSEKTTFPNGGTASVDYGPDPRFGMLAPVVKQFVGTTPGGKTSTITTTRTASLANPTNLLSLVQQTETVTDNGNTMTRVYDAATRTFTLTTPEGRSSTATLDALGRIVNRQPGPGVSPIINTYDTLGRLSLETQGALSRSYGYDAANRLTSVTDGAGHTTTYGYDAADRMTDTTTPAGNHYHMTYDANGNTTSVTMPNGAIHALGYTPGNDDDTYTAPGSAAQDRAYDSDGEWINTLLAGGRTLSASYDAAGRPAGRAYPEASTTFGYGDATERMTTMTRTPLTGPAATVTTAWDAELPTGMSATGAATGQYTFGYDGRLLLASMNLTSGADTANIALTRDLDGMITKYGPFDITHGGPAGAADTIGDGQLAITSTYDALGRVTQRKHVVAATTAYQVDLSYNSAGKISQRIETTGAGTETRVFTYDADGQLTQVTTGGSTTESYAYDANGNRSPAAAAATYDAADQLTSLGSLPYSFDGDGYLATRGADTFQYSARGELLSATVGGQTVTYAYDALGRRVSRTQSGATTEYLYGNPNNPFQVTASHEPSGALSVYYYGPGGALFAMDRAGVRYYVASDQVGSPRVITNTAGTVVETLQYDSYGKLLADSNPPFALTLGYGGGIGDSTTGLVHFGFRDYDPAAGVWTSRDPALFTGGSANLYGYVDGDPVSRVDPSGLWAVTFGGTVYDGIGGGATITIGSDGVKVCGEVGVGVGGGLEAGLSDKVGDTDTTVSLVAEASAKVGLLKTTANYELSRGVGSGHCTHGKFKWSVGIPGASGEDLTLGFGSNGDPQGVKFKKGPAEGPGSSLKVPDSGLSVSAKAAVKVCGGGKW